MKADKAGSAGYQDSSGDPWIVAIGFLLIHMVNVPPLFLFIVYLAGLLTSVNDYETSK